MAARLTAYIVALIVGLTFIAGLIVGAQRDDHGPVDLMVLNGRVYTADGQGTMAEAVAIQGNKILLVGTTREIQRLRRVQTVVIDARGGAVLPGFIDRRARLLDAVRLHAGESSTLPPTRAEQRDALRAITADAHRRGVTSVHDVEDTPQDLALYDELRRAGGLRLRIYGALAVRRALSPRELDDLDAVRSRYPDDPVLKAGVVRIVVDSAGTEPAFAPAALNGLVAELDRRGWQIAIDARDDGAVRMANEAYAHAMAANPAPARGRRHLIEDAIDGPVDFAAFEALGVVSPAMLGDGASLEQTIDASTRDAAWVSFDEHRKGSLARDMLADVVVLAGDIFGRGGSLEDAEVSVTIFDGKIVFRKTGEIGN